MTAESTSFTVRFGKAARTLEYRDGAGCIEFTFDLGAEERALVLEHHGVRQSRLSNYDDAFLRSKQFLQSCGYKVAESGVARLPAPMTFEEAAALIRAETIGPVPSSVRLIDLPIRASFEDDAGDTPWSLWLVAELKAGSHSGHKLVFDEHTRQFGVASPKNVFLGFWGSFRQTLEALVAA